MSWTTVLEIISIPAVSSAIAVVIAVYIAHWLGKRQRLYEVKSGVLRELIGRRANFQDPGFKIALNSIPVIFHDNEDIKTAWREFYDVIKESKRHPGSLSEELLNKKFIVLVLAICESLNIKAKENDVLLVFK